MHTALHARYEINDELVKILRCAVPGRLVVSSHGSFAVSSRRKGLKEAEVAGNQARFVITTKDSSQKQCYDENDQIIVKVD